MGNVATSEFPVNTGTGVSGDNLQGLLLRMIQEVSRQMVEDASRAAEEQIRRWMEDTIGSVGERIRGLEESMNIMNERLENRITNIEERLNQLERCQCSKQPKQRDNLEERVQSLELSLNSTLQSVLPRVEMLINQLGDQSRSRMMDISPHHPFTNQLLTPPPDPSGILTLQNTLEDHLKQACKDGRIDEVRRLLDAGANMEIRDCFGGTPFLISVFHEHLDIVRLLVERGTNVKAKSNFGVGALHVAAKKNNPECISYLLSVGSDVNCRDNNGWTPLHWAASSDSEDAIRFLLSVGADPNPSDKFGMVPLDLAGTESVRKLLRK